MTPSSQWEVGLKAKPFTGLKGGHCLRQTLTDERRRRSLLMVPAGKPVRERDRVEEVKERERILSIEKWLMGS